MPTKKHYLKGSPLPPLQPGIIRIYSMRFCPYVQRTVLVLNYFNIQHEVVNVNLKQKPDWLFEKNPLGLVPILELDDKIIYESLICNEYLDQVYCNNQLLTKDPYKKAQQKMLIERFRKVEAAYYMALTAKNEELESLFDKIEEGLKLFESNLNEKFFGGDVPNFLDFAIWPWFERFPLLHKLTGVDILRRNNSFPKLISWVSIMESLPTVKASILPLDIHAQFVKQYLDPSVTHIDCDVGVN